MINNNWNWLQWVGAIAGFAAILGFIAYAEYAAKENCKRLDPTSSPVIVRGRSTNLCINTSGKVFPRY